MVFCYPAPIPLIDIIQSYDHFRPATFKGTRTNMLVEQMHYLDPQQSNVLKAMISDDQWYDSDYVARYATNKPTPIGPLEVQIQATFEEVNRLYAAQKAYLHQVDIVSYDPFTISITDNSLITVLNDDFRMALHPQTWYIEQFSGAYGGWSFAKEFLQQHGIAKTQGMCTIAVEQDLPSAVQFALNHGHSILGDSQHIPANFVFNNPKDYVFVSKIQDFQWRKQIEWLPIDLWSISAPCQSWSTASHQQGFSTKNGIALAESVAQIRVHRPKVVLLENVSGITEHPQFILIQRLMTWAGYVEVGSDIYDLADVTPVKRPRFLALYIRNDLFDSSMTFSGWPTPNQSIPRTFDAIFPLTVSENSKFAPKEKDLQRYFEKDLMPGKLRVWNQRDVLGYRIPSLDLKLQTFMGAYGEQHLLPPYSLQTSGLFGQFQRQGAIVRFWTPIEIAMLQVQPKPIILLKPARLSWQALGNSISPVHAVYLMTQALQILQYIDAYFQVEKVVEHMIENRLRVGSTAMKQDEFAWYLGSSVQNDLNQQRLHQFVAAMSWQDDTPRTWPVNGYFDIKDGFLSFDVPILEGAQNTIPVSPTQNFPILFQLQLILVPGEYGTYQVDGTMKWRTLLALWDFRLRPDLQTWDLNLLDKSLKETLVTDRVQLIPIDHEETLNMQVSTSEESVQSLPLIVQESIDLSIYEITNAVTWQDIKAKNPLPDGNFMDAFGVVHSSHKFLHPTMLTLQDQPIEPVADFGDIYAGMLGVQFETWIPSNTDHLVMHCTGSANHMRSFLAFWAHSQLSSWSKQLGRRQLIQHIDEENVRIIFAARHPSTAIPAKMLREELLIRILRILMLTMNQDTDDSSIVLWSMKYRGKLIDGGALGIHATFEPWIYLLEHVFQLSVFRGQPTMVAAAQRITELTTMQDIVDRMKNSNRGVVLHVVEELTGGGPPRNPTTKQDFHRFVESGLANLLMDHGMDLPQMAPNVTLLIDNFGLPRLHHLLVAEPETQRHESFIRLCDAINLKLPQNGSRKAVADAKFKKSKQQHAVNPLSIQVDQYMLQEGFFVNADGTPAQLLSSFSPQASGVMLMEATAALEWMQVATNPGPDELGIYVTGPINIPPRFATISTNAPAKDLAGRPVLLNGTLIQFGEKHLKTVQLAEESISTNDVQIAAVTVWKDDFEPAMWEALVQTPVKTVKSLLSLDGYQGLCGKPWGRVYQHNGTVVEPAKATSIQFHCEFDKGARFSSMLKRSGFNKLYVTPKDEQGRIDPSWQVIWLDIPVKQIEAKTAGLQGTAGLIRGKKSYGLRVEAGAFGSVWERIKPGQDCPDNRQTKYLFKVQPFPNGTDSAVLINWSQKIGWSIKPIKALGAKQWILGSDECPPNILMFNTQPLLVQQIHQKGIKPTGAIAVGPKQLKSAASKPTLISEHSKAVRPNIFRTGDPFHDAWATYTPSSPSDVPMPCPPKQSFPERPPTGPIADLLQQQDERIHAVENLVAKLQDTHQENAKEVEQRFHHLEDTVAKTSHSTQQQLEAVHAEHRALHNTIAVAMQKNEEKFASGFDELKALFLSSRGIKRHVPEQDDEELEPAL